jgi:hypothetical protein
MNPVIKSALVRAVRTFVQAFLGTYTALLLIGEPVSTFAALLDRRALEAGAVAGVIALLSFVQNTIEGHRDVTYDRG